MLEFVVFYGLDAFTVFRMDQVKWLLVVKYYRNEGVVSIVEVVFNKAIFKGL